MPDRALVVEDDPAMLEACAEVLQQAAYKVVKAVDSEAAEAILRTQAIDVAVIDLRMPTMGGSTCSEWRRRSTRRSRWC